MENTSEGPTFCGGFTYSLVYESGSLELDTNPLATYDIVPATAS